MITATSSSLMQTRGINIKYGITEKKKSEIDNLVMQVLDAQHEVDQFQAIVTSLTQKLNNFQGYLAMADNNRTLALNNKNMKDQLVQSAQDLQANSGIAFDEVTLANVQSKKLAGLLKIVMDELIYCVDIINKLSNLVISKKAVNPLISDELVTLMGTAGNDANNAVALTLVALKSTFAVQASNLEAEAAGSLQYTQAISLYGALTFVMPNTSGVVVPPLPSNVPVTKKVPQSISTLLDTAYVNAKIAFEQIQKACNITAVQLNRATSALNKAQVQLKSLQAGLNAANAAALAS
jgi:hypothetical protein